MKSFYNYAKKVKLPLGNPLEEYQIMKGYYNNLILTYSYPYCGLNNLTLNEFKSTRTAIFHELKRVEKWLQANNPLEIYI